ncbi:MAG: helix-turn-helix domain-containing protein [Actinomycetota bacterium]
MTTSVEHRRRVDLVIDHVRSGAEDDSLRDLARIAGYSPFHFHRIFLAVTGETLGDFTRRARLERAVAIMRTDCDRPLTAVAGDVGFATPSEFSRVFRERFGVAPSRWNRRDRLDVGESLADPSMTAASFDEDRVVERTRPATTVVATRVRDPWRSGRLVAAVGGMADSWAERGLAWGSASVVGLSWEDELSTPLERLSYDVGVVVSPDSAADASRADESLHRLAAARTVEVDCAGLTDAALAWPTLYRWIAERPDAPVDRPAVKWFDHAPGTDPSEWRFACSIAIA